ncbi:hypothetical protein N9R46_01035 [Gammaproteobacteria bacterium]|nr:hypothetical protein [Gammaproteobacteria bacterium]|tara:strand:- start:406 stop:1212 length:807 start_codon:yes stop_codon:yes gene_type:complete
MKIIDFKQRYLVLKTILLIIAISLITLNLLPSQMRSLEPLDEILPNSASLILKKDVCINRITLLDNKQRSYLYDLTKLVNQCIIHYWVDDEVDLQKSLNIWIPPEENYVLHFAAYFIPKLRSIELYDIEKIIERGIGACSQYAILIDEILESNGYESNLIGLNGHVVVEAKTLTGEKIVLDADYGVIIPESISFIEKNPSIIKDFYPTKVELLTEIYQSRNYIDDDSYHPNHKILRMITTFSYWIAWIIPLLLLSTIFWLQAKRKTQI